MGCTLVGLVALSIAANFVELIMAACLIGIGSAIFHPESSRVARFASGGKHGFATENAKCLAKIFIHVRPSDVFDHPHTHQLVTVSKFMKVAIVKVPNLAAIRQPCGADTVFGESCLGLTEGDAGGADSVLPRCMNNQAAPPAPNIHEPLAGCQAKSSADSVHLLQLCCIEIIFCIPEISARVHHVPIEPQSIKLIGDIVVILHCFLVARFGCGCPRSGPSIFPVWPISRPERLANILMP